MNLPFRTQGFWRKMCMYLKGECCENFPERLKWTRMNAWIDERTCFGNIDHLFDLPDNYFYAVMDCFCEKTWSHTPQFQIGYCQQCPDKVQWPSHFGTKPPLYFNAGMFVYEPNLNTYRHLLQTVQVIKPTSFAEQVYICSINSMLHMKKKKNMLYDVLTELVLELE